MGRVAAGPGWPWRGRRGSFPGPGSRTCVFPKKMQGRCSAQPCDNCDSLALSLDHKKLRKYPPLFPQKTVMNTARSHFRMRKLPPASGSALPGKGVTCSVKPLVLESVELGWREYGQGSGKRWGKVQGASCQVDSGKKVGCKQVRKLSVVLSTAKAAGQHLLPGVCP